MAARLAMLRKRLGLDPAGPRTPPRADAPHRVGDPRPAVLEPDGARASRR